MWTWPKWTKRLVRTPDVPESTGYELHGQRRPARNARDVLVLVLRKFVERDRSFLERFASLPKPGRSVAVSAMEDVLRDDPGVGYEEPE